MNLLRPGTVDDFALVWSDVKRVVDALLAGERVDSDAWNEIFLDIYHVCVSADGQLGTVLHHQIKSCVEEYVDGLYQEIVTAETEDILLEKYFSHWEHFSKAVEHLNLLFGYVNLNVVKKHKYSKVNIDYSQYGIKYEDNLLEIGEMAFDVWERKIVRTKSKELIKAVLDTIQRDRLGIKVDHVALKAVISSFIVLRKFRTCSHLQLYEELFEIPFFKASTNFFMEESKRLLELSDCSEFMRSILERMKSETVLSCRYLNPSSHFRLRLECLDRLLSDNVDYINQHCREMLRSDKWIDMGTMYELLSSLDNGLDFMVSEFEQHLQETGLKKMQSLTNDSEKLSTHFVELMLEFHGHYSEAIKTVFRRNPRFISALDKACAVTVNHKSSPKAVCKSPELLAKHCDDLLRRGSRASSDVELDDSFGRVIILFSYIDDKDIFCKFYARLMARRLIFHLSRSPDAEELMVNKFRQLCGFEYTRNLLRMLTDVTVSSDLNAQFKKYIDADLRKRKLSHGYFVQILQADAWPIGHSNLLEFNFPPELEKFIHEFENFYTSQFSGRKLIWLYSLSLVELKFCHLARPYLVTTEILLASVLLQFNHTDILPYGDLLDLCRLKHQELTKQLQLLVDSKILNMEGSVVEKSVFRLNFDFTSKRTKFKLLHANQSEVAQEEERQLVSSVEQSRRFYLQASIVRTMKARRRLKHNELIEEVVNQTRARFVPHVSTIKKCIEVLVEKQYIDRVPKSDNVYVYVA